MPNQITRRIYDYLKTIPPFSFVDDAEALMAVARRVDVLYQAADSVIFEAGQSPNDRFYVVKEGAVELLDGTGGETRLVDRKGEGDVFGIRPLLADDNYLFTARAAEDTLLYAVDGTGIKELLPNYPRVMTYLTTSMAGSARVLRMAATPPPTPELPLDGLAAIPARRAPVTVRPTARIREAAIEMTTHNVGSVVVTDRGGRPVGIITDQDLRGKVATGKRSPDDLVTTIMRGPVHCVGPNVTMADVQIEMVRKGVNHLVQTEDGGDQSPVVGVLSKHDLLVIQGNNPAVLIREIQRARDAAYLKTLRRRAEKLLATYLEREVSIGFITTIMTRINDEIIRKCMKLGLARMQADGRGNPPALFDWLALGSQGRGEQLLRTDQDNALIFEDVPPGRYPAVKAYFLQLAEYVTTALNTVGFSYCKGDMMASNPKWCLSVSAWRDQFSSWMTATTSESMLHTSIFFDYRGVWGDGSLPAKLTEHVFAELESHGTRFLATLALAAVTNPSPLTFFRNFVVERGGEHKHQFDLKSRAMRPLTDAARVLMLERRQAKENNTFRRFELLAELEPQNAELYQAAAQSYEVLIRLRATMGLRRKDSGRFLKPTELTRIQRLLLRNSFEPVKEIQSLLEMRFQLNFLR